MKQIDYVWIVSPIGYAHSHAFDVIADAFSHELKALGHKAEVTREFKHAVTNGVRLIFGAHLMSYPMLREHDIIYNSEQVGSPVVKPEYIRMLKSREVWDYSKVNIERLEKDHGIKAKHVPIGYSPTMTNPLIPVREQDIDVLFYGSINQRRRAILDQLKAKGLKVVELFGVYGDKLDEYLGRSKIVLNVHYYDTAIFEIFRCAYLFANKKCVVSELSVDKSLSLKLDYPNVLASYGGLAAVCEGLVCNKKSRDDLSKSEFEAFSRTSLRSILQEALK